MTRNEILIKIAEIYGPEYVTNPNRWGTSLGVLLDLFAEETPEYKFALRGDLKDDLRFLPTRAEPMATGWDVRAAGPFENNSRCLIIRPGDYVKIPLGVRGFCPDGWWYKIVPRSSSFVKKSLHALYGTVDQNYEGELIFGAQYNPKTCSGDGLIIEHGEAIAQIIPVKRQEMKVSHISNEEYRSLCKMRNGQRGDGGFGSTDGNTK